MQLGKKTRKQYSPNYVDENGVIRFYEKNGNFLKYKSLRACQNFLDKQTEEIKGYKEDVLTEKFIVFGLPKGGRYKLGNGIPSKTETH
jgi:hypothetical protein